MAKEVLNTVGLSQTQAIFKFAAKAVSMQKGDILEVVANHKDFEEMIKTWCDRLKKPSLITKGENNMVKCQIVF